MNVCICGVSVCLCVYCVRMCVCVSMYVACYAVCICALYIYDVCVGNLLEHKEAN